MTRYFIHWESGGVEEISDAAYNVLVAGTVIRAVRSKFPGFELDLSENLRVRAIADGQDTYLHISSTMADDDVRPTRIQLSAGHGELSLLDVENRLRHLRQLYAILVLLNSDRAQLLPQFLEDNPEIDLEQLLEEDERLVLEAAGQGSFWASVKAGAKKIGGFAATAPKAAALTIGALFDDGRRILMEYLQGVADEQKAKAHLKNAEAHLKNAEAKKALAEAERTSAETRKIDEGLRIDRDRAILDTYKLADETIGKANSPIVKKAIEKHITGANPDLPTPPPDG